MQMKNQIKKHLEWAYNKKEITKDIDIEVLGNFNKKRKTNIVFYESRITSGNKSKKSK